MATLLEALHNARKKEEQAWEEISRAEEAIKMSSDLKFGDTVLIVGGSRNPSDSDINEDGKALIGKITSIGRVKVGYYGDLSFTTQIRDSRGLLWSWERCELKKLI